MTQAAYFESDVVGDDAATLANGATIFAPAGATLPPGLEARALPNERDGDRLAVLMRWLTRLAEALPDPELAEIARFDLMFGLSRAHQAAGALRALRQQGFDRVDWFTPASAWREPWRMLLKPTARALGLELNLRRVAAPREAAGAVDQLKELLYPWVSLARRAVPARVSSARRTPVLFVEYFRNNVHVVAPIVRALRAQGLEAAVLAGRPEVSAALPADVPSLELDALLPRATRLNVIPPLPLERSAHLALATAPTSLFEGEAGPLHRAALVPLLARALWAAHGWRERFDAAYRELEPRVVASTTYSSALGRASAASAHRRGRPSLWVQHGMFPDQEVWSYFLHQHLAVFGEATAESITRHGIASERVHPLGATLYDDFVGEAKRAPRAELPRKIVFFASRSGGMVVSLEASRATLALAVEATRRTGLSLVIKPHPGDATRIPEEACQGHPHACVVRDRPSQAVMLEADAVLVTSSTVGFEACIARRPLIELNPEGVNEAGVWAKEGAALIARTGPQLEAALQALQDPTIRAQLEAGQAKLLARHLAGARGDAAQRIAGQLGALAETT